MIQRAVKTMYENPREGDLLMDAPATESWSGLKNLAAEKGNWALGVRKIKDSIHIRKHGKTEKRKGKKKTEDGGKKKKKKCENKTAKKETEERGKGEEEEDGRGSDEDNWRPKNTGPRKRIEAPIRFNDGFMMSVQASREHYSTPRDDVGPYTAVEVAGPNRREELLLPYGSSTMGPGGWPEVYAKVPTAVIYKIIIAHAGIRTGRLSPLVEIDEDGHEWAAAAMPTPSLESVSEEEEEESEGEEWAEEAFTSVVHMGAPPPPPPPLPTTRTTGPIQSPPALLMEAMSPIEKTQEQF